MNLYMAPIKDITTAFYRNLFTEIFGGFDGYYAPFVSTTHMRKRSSPLFRDILPENNQAQTNLVPQVLSNDADDFNFFASVIADMGYQEINWNIGCPAPYIVRKKRGSGMMAHPDMIRDFLEKVCSDKNYDLSVKMRLGFRSLDEGMPVIDILNDYPISKIIIHGRTGDMIYRGASSVPAFKTLQEACHHEVIYNGDITSQESFDVIREQLPEVDGFMIGRGLLRNPFLPSELKGAVYTDEEKYSKIKTFHDTIYGRFKADYDDEGYLCSKMKEFWFYAADVVSPDGTFLKEVRRCKDIKSYETVCKKWLKGL